HANRVVHFLTHEKDLEAARSEALGRQRIVCLFFFLFFNLIKNRLPAKKTEEKPKAKPSKKEKNEDEEEHTASDNKSDDDTNTKLRFFFWKKKKKETGAKKEKEDSSKKPKEKEKEKEKTDGLLKTANEGDDTWLDAFTPEDKDATGTGDDGGKYTFAAFDD
ncbi:hypothetical protein RFI_11140, partial [Reticulomyxa filosa]